MKDLFKIHYSFILFIILLLTMGYINYVFIFLIIIVIHELGHIIVIKLLHYKIESIALYATGGVIKTNININIRSLHLFLISISGIMMQLILFLFPLRCMLNSNIFDKINITLIIFNLIPIYPSDGYKILLSIIERFHSYSKIIKFSYMISFLSLIALFIKSKSIVIFVSLYIINIKYILEYRYLIEKFFVERYLYGIKYKRPKIVKKIEDIYKCRNNYIKYGNIFKEEKEYYQEKYAKFIDI